MWLKKEWFLWTRLSIKGQRGSSSYDYIKEPVLQLYPAGEAAQSMPTLWKEFLVDSQNARDQIGLHTLGNFLSKEEYDAINLVDCSRQFPALITSKGALRSKNNALATSRASRSGGSLPQTLPQNLIIDRIY